MMMEWNGWMDGWMDGWNCHFQCLLKFLFSGHNISHWMDIICITLDKFGGCFTVCCSGVSLQHSQSASPPDIRDYNQNLGLSVDGGRQLQAAKIPEHLPADHTRYPHVTQIPQPQVPQPPAAYDGAVPARSRARNQRASETSSASRSPVDERRVIDDRPTDGGVSVRVSDVDRRMPLAPNISTHFTSDISLASSNVTTYEDNGRQKVCLWTDLFTLLIRARKCGGFVRWRCPSVSLFVRLSVTREIY